MSHLPHLTNAERVAYALGYVFCILFGGWQLLILNKKIYQSTDRNGFSDGWSILARPKDRMDGEWMMWTGLVKRSWMWFAWHLVSSEVTRGLSKHVTKFLHILGGMAFVSTSFGVPIVVLVLFKITTFLAVMTLGRKSLLWIYIVVWIVLMRVQAVTDWLQLLLIGPKPNDEQLYELMLLLSWNQLKVLSACLDLVDPNSKTGDGDILSVYAYMFYPPNLVCGPIFLFERYTRMMDERKVHRRFRSSFFGLGINMLRVVFWYFFMEVALHYAYVASLQTNIRMVNSLNGWTLYSFGHILAVLFYAKYSAMYGFAMALAQFDGMVTPSRPRYIGLVHWFSDMWKHFDTGLYEFLFKYIYSALCQRSSSFRSKIACSAVIFSFVFLWHGMFTFICVWAGLNFIVLLLENVGRSVCRVNRTLIDQYLSATNQQRCAALLGSQLYILGALSNFIFFADTEVGEVFFRRTYWTGGWVVYGCVTAMCMCLFHTAEWVNARRRVDGGEIRRSDEILL